MLTRGTLRRCDACTVAKAKQKNVIKKSAHIAATKKDEWHIFIDISTVKKAKKGKDLARPVEIQYLAPLSSAIALL
jgi:hypothetical protein